MRTAITTLLTLALAATAANAEPLRVGVSHSARIGIGGAAASVIVGNAEVADVTVIDSHTVFVTGRTPGVSEVAVLDGLGRTLYSREVVVSGTGHSVSVFRAGARADLSFEPSSGAWVASTASDPSRTASADRTGARSAPSEMIAGAMPPAPYPGSLPPAR